jgi:hypothetical protein
MVTWLYGYMFTWLYGYMVIQQAVPNGSSSINSVQAIPRMFCLHECLSLHFFLVDLHFVSCFDCIHTLIWESVYRSLTSVHFFLRIFCKTLNVVLRPLSIMFCALQTNRRAAVNHNNVCCSRQHVHERGASGKYQAILNISRTGRVALMYLGSQSEETLLCIREQSSMGLVSRQWDAIDWSRVLCDRRVHNGRESRLTIPVIFVVADGSPSVSFEYEIPQRDELYENCSASIDIPRNFHYSIVWPVFCLGLLWTAFTFHKMYCCRLARKAFTLQIVAQAEFETVWCLRLVTDFFFPWYKITSTDASCVLCLRVNIIIFCCVSDRRVA